MAPHPVVELTSEASWAVVRVLLCFYTGTYLIAQIEDKFTPFGKETLAKLIAFLHVCPHQ
jgi:acyl-CoA dehydrogenase